MARQFHIAPATVNAFRRALPRWYRRHKRDLPWRRTRDPYAIWISEAMLQQTRVETVVSYWRRFLELFPNVATLAAADERDVLAAWSGLGYYRRARALHSAARAIVERHGGEFPSDANHVRELPGIGPYTAGAVLSIAFDQPEALVDGNVARVFCRLFELDAPHESPALKRELWNLARRLVPQDGGAGEWNQALMELGATICTPRSPSCASCPLERRCKASANGRVLELPRTKTRRAPIEVELEARLVDALRDPLPVADVAVANVLLAPVETILGRVNVAAVVTSGYLAREVPAHRGWERVVTKILDGWAADLFRREPARR
jgi:A/G-specific adenine glycosylase